MSSFYDSSGYTSRNDSMPVGESGSDYLDAEGSLNSGQASQEEEEEAAYALANVGRARRRGDAGAGARLGIASSGATGLSSDLYSGQTSYLTRSETMSQPTFYEPEDYTSGYGSLSYDYDYDLSDPRSGSELSSTLVSFFQANETVARVRAMGYFFRRPILFGLLAAGGNGALAGLLRAVPAWTPRAGPGLSAEGLRALAVGGGGVGGADIPGWLREVRAGLPAVVERPAAWALRARGVPILSELQASSRSAADAMARKLQAAAAGGWEKSRPMIPVGVFLPIFTYLALYIASRVIARRAERRRLLLFGDELSQVEPISGTENHLFSRDYSELAFGANLGLALGKDAREGDDRQHSITTAPASMREHQAALHAGDPAKEAEKNLLPKLELPVIGTDLDEDPVLQEESPATTRTRLPMPTPVDVPSQNAPPAPSPDPIGVPPLPMKRANTASRSRESSLPQQISVLSRGGLPTLGAVQLRGHQIFLVLLGTPSVVESNSLLVAALRYGVPAVLLPDSMANEPRLMEVPPTELQIEFAQDPLAYALDRANAYALEVIAMHQTNEFAPDARSLFTFSHPVGALYLFAPPSQEEVLAPAMARASATQLFVGAASHAERGIPVNECLYDRLRKEQG